MAARTVGRRAGGLVRGPADHGDGRRGSPGSRALLHVAQPARVRHRPATRTPRGAAALGPPEATAFRVHDRFAQARARGGTHDQGRRPAAGRVDLDRSSGSSPAEGTRRASCRCSPLPRASRWSGSRTRRALRDPGRRPTRTGPTARGPGDRWRRTHPDAHRGSGAFHRGRDDRPRVARAARRGPLLHRGRCRPAALRQLRRHPDLPHARFAALTRAKAGARPTRPADRAAHEVRSGRALCATRRSRTSPRGLAPALVFVYGFLGPIAVFARCTACGRRVRRYGSHVCWWRCASCSSSSPSSSTCRCSSPAQPGRHQRHVRREPVPARVLPARDGGAAGGHLHVREAAARGARHAVAADRDPRRDLPRAVPVAAATTALDDRAARRYAQLDGHPAEC